MTNQINAKEYNLWDLMSGEFIFHIPDYQRPYSWTENEAVTLWDDLIEFWQNAKGTEDQTYFAGSIVLVKKDDSPESEVIDGQQRLSTLSMILSIIAQYSCNLKKDIQKCLWEEGIQHKKIAGKARLTLRKRDALFFEKYIAKGEMSHLASIDPKQLEDDAQRLLLINGTTIMKKAKELFGDNGEQADSFITALFNQCFFVVVTTPDNESAFRVFSVMNNRGLSLLPSDIIKAHIIGAIDEDSRQYYTDKWEDIEVDLGRDSFNSLLSHIRMIYSKNKLHGTLVAEFEKAVFTEHEKKEDLITEILEPYSQAYKTIIRNMYAASNGAEDVNELLSWLNRIDDSDWIPSLMLALVSFGNDAAFIKEFARALERLASFFYLTSKTSNQRIERYAKVISALQAGQKELAVEELQLQSYEKGDLLSVLDGDVYLMPARKRSYLVLRLDRIISDKATIYQNNIFSIEHVLPQNPKPDSQWIKDWPDSNEREYWLHKIANLIPLTRKKNSQAQNYNFAEKKQKYFSEKNGVSSYALATGIILESSWTPETVANRQKQLLAVFSRYWSLSSSTPGSSADQPKASPNGPVTPPVAKEAELLQQERLYKEIEKFFAANPGTKLPKLIMEEVKVGEYVHRAMHRLSISEYLFPDGVLERLCTVEGSRKYTHRNLPFLVPAESADLESNMMKRYWKTPSYVESYNGKQYYVYSQWYPDHKDSKDAHKSDFLQFYLDLARNSI